MVTQRPLILADTHLPRRAGDLPAQVWQKVDAADVGIHAGDWGDVTTLDVLVFGHSHIPWDTASETGLRLLNPGSPTDRRRQPRCTCLTALAADGVLSDEVLHELPPRVPAGPSH